MLKDLGNQKLPRFKAGAPLLEQVTILSGIRRRQIRRACLKCSRTLQVPLFAGQVQALKLQTMEPWQNAKQFAIDANIGRLPPALEWGNA